MAEDDTRVEKENKRLGEFGNHTIVKVRNIFSVPVSEERVENDSSGSNLSRMGCCWKF